MIHVQKSILFIIICLSITGAIFLEFFPATSLYNKILGKPALHGFQTSFKLSNYPMRNHLDQEVTWKSFNDRPLYITTGFTLCSYTCPVTMVFYQKLKHSTADNANYALFSIDPHNDSPKILNSFLKPFDSDFIGLQVKNQKHFKTALSELNQSIADIAGEQNILHQDFIYLLHPKLDGLVVYTTHNLELILNDYQLLTQI